MSLPIPQYKIDAEPKVREICQMVAFEINGQPASVEGMPYYRQLLLEMVVAKLERAI